MDAFKFIFKWSSIFFGVMFVIALMGEYTIKSEKQEYATLQTAIKEKRVLSDMTPEQVRQIWGKPDHITLGEFNGVAVEQWTYTATAPHYNNAKYVGFRNGRAVLINAGQPTH